MKNLKTIGCRASAINLVLAVLPGGISHVLRLPETVAGMTRLGSPVYSVTILGVRKVPGEAALLLPDFTRLKEWAYAGIFFEMSGAAVSHAASGSAGWHVAVMAGSALVAVVSWALRRQDRILGSILPTQDATELRNGSTRCIV